jgi:IS1 family transposase
VGGNTKTGRKLRSEIRERADGTVAPGYRRSCNGIASEEALVQTNAETYTVKKYNGQTRHLLARSERKKKYYSKSRMMMESPLELSMAERNNLITMQNYQFPKL